MDSPREVNAQLVPLALGFFLVAMVLTAHADDEQQQPPSCGYRNEDVRLLPLCEGYEAPEDSNLTSAEAGTVLKKLQYGLPMKCVIGEAWVGTRDGHAPTASMPYLPRATCELFMANNDQCGIWNGSETLEQCVKRIGITPWTKAMHPKCTRSQFWKTLRRKLKPLETPLQRKASSKPLRSRVFAASTYRPNRYVPPSERTYAHMPPPRQCGFGPVHYFGFSVSRDMIVDRVPRAKVWDFSPLYPRPLGSRSGSRIPYNHPKYILGPFDEPLAGEIYSASYFTYTHRRVGYDCGRHVEVLASGTVPYWADIAVTPSWALVHYPKKLLKEALSLPGVEAVGKPDRGGGVDTEYLLSDGGGDYVNFRKPGAINKATFDKDKYYDLADRILNFTKNHLTCGAMVAYILKTIGYEEPKSIFLANKFHMDYAGTPVECGLSELGLNYTTFQADEWRDDQSPFERPDIGEDPDYTAEQHESTIRFRKAYEEYGNGYIWTLRINRPPNPRLHREEARTAIMARQFDLIIFPSYQIENTLMPEALAVMADKRIVIIDTDDHGSSSVYQFAARHSSKVAMFAREQLPDKTGPNGCHGDPSPDWG